MRKLIRAGWGNGMGCQLRAAVWGVAIFVQAPRIKGAGIQPVLCSLSHASCAGW